MHAAITSHAGNAKQNLIKRENETKHSKLKKQIDMHKGWVRLAKTFTFGNTTQQGDHICIRMLLLLLDVV
jgi:hypothetical protein